MSGEVGVMKHLACFFKNPHGVAVHDFFEQFAMLEQYVARAAEGHGATDRHRQEKDRYLTERATGMPERKTCRRRHSRTRIGHSASGFLPFGIGGEARFSRGRLGSIL